VGRIVRLLAVDGSSIAHRAWHSTRDDPGDDDLTAVVAAMASMLASTWRHGPYDVALVALDHPVNRRRELFPAYKAQRSPTDPALRVVLDALPAALRAAGVPIRVREGAEADDLLAAAADDGARRGWRTDLLSSDRDLTALVGPRVRLLRPRRRFADLAVEDEAAVEAEHGVPARRYRDLAALRGDPSDGLEGAPGIGPATAARLLREFGDVPTLYRALADLPPRTAASLRRGREAVERNLLLMAPLPHLDAELEAAVAAGPPLVGLVADLEARGADGAASRLRRALAGGAPRTGGMAGGGGPTGRGAREVREAPSLPPLPPPPDRPG
jgi:5'-3' exonuclease